MLPVCWKVDLYVWVHGASGWNSMWLREGASAMEIRPYGFARFGQTVHYSESNLMRDNKARAHSSGVEQFRICTRFGACTD